MRTSLPPKMNVLNTLNKALGTTTPKNLMIAGVLGTALLAFELFNFDTTRYALNSLLGEVTFAGLGWATILAIAFCAIDFAGLARLFTPEKGRDEPKEVWYLMGAWLLGASMNAVMTWWAVSLTLLNHNLGNEILSREQLLEIVPIFVAVLVWLTRILFIGSLTVAGEHLFDQSGVGTAASTQTRKQPQQQPAPAVRQQPTPPTMPTPNLRGPQPATNLRRPSTAAGFSGSTSRPAAPAHFSPPTPATTTLRDEDEQEGMNTPVRQNVPQPASRIHRRPPVAGIRPGMPVGMQAKSRDQ